MPATCAGETHAGSRELQQMPNPLTAGQVLQVVRRLEEGYLHHSVSLTGGEPLLHQPFLDELLSLLHYEEHRSFLETNGTLVDAFNALALVPHFVAMDMKLPSITACPPSWDVHEAFLRVAMRRMSRTDGGFALPDRLQVKLVFGADSLPDITRAAEVIAACRADIPCILQPVTPRPGVVAPDPALVLEAQRLASLLLTDVRVIPQTHVLLHQW